MLGVAHAEHSPELKCSTDGGASACPEAWEMRNMYIVEASPRRELISQALQGKTIIYMDSEMWFEPYIDEYDQKGQLWLNHIWWTTYRDRPVPDARVAIYPFKREFEVGAVSTDVQSGFATMCYLPGPANSRARVLVHQHGRGGQEFLHDRRDGQGCAVALT